MRLTGPVRDIVAFVEILSSVEKDPELVEVGERVEQLLAVTCEDIDSVVVGVEVVTED